MRRKVGRGGTRRRSRDKKSRYRGEKGNCWRYKSGTLQELSENQEQNGKIRAQLQEREEQLFETKELNARKYEAPVLEKQKVEAQLQEKQEQLSEAKIQAQERKAGVQSLESRTCTEVETQTDPPRADHNE